MRKLAPRRALDLYHRFLAFAGAALYWFPSRQLTVIGVTGTKGKTTTVHAIVRILEEAGYKVGAISGLYFKVGKSERPSCRKMTMPGRFSIQRHLRHAALAGCTHAVIEVTSEGIAQHRHRYIEFDTAVFTNIAPEHLDSHGSLEKYLAAKQELFAGLAGSLRAKRIRGKRVRKEKVIVANGDDPHADDFLSFAADRKLCCHVGPPDETGELSVCEHVVAERLVERENGTSFAVRGTPFTLVLPGAFNVANALAAIAVGMSEGIAFPCAADALSKIKNVPGRMEFMDAGQSFEAVVDYAHTPDSLDAVLRTLRGRMERSARQKNRLICVLGAAGGGRDRWKRPVLGAAAAIWSDEVIVTNEDPYGEDPVRIMEDVMNGAENARRVYREYFGEEIFSERGASIIPMPQKIPDRRTAIRKALTIARAGDTVVIAGKGSEQVMAVGERHIPWDERGVVREEIAKMLAGKQ